MAMLPATHFLFRWHRLSALVLLVFVVAHLSNHLLALHSIALHQQAMHLLRRVYRHPVAETMLLAAVLGQVLSGILLLRQAPPVGCVARAQCYAGLYLAYFLLMHVGAVLVGRLCQHLDTDFYFAAVGLNIAPLPWYFVPYYVLAVTALFAHLAAAHYRKRQNRRRAAPEAWALLLGGLALGLVLLLGFTDYLRGVPIPPAYVPAALRQ